MTKQLITVYVNGLIIIKVFYSQTDAQVNCLINNFKIYIKTTPKCFSAVTPSSGSALLVLANVAVGYFNNCNFSKHV